MTKDYTKILKDKFAEDHKSVHLQVQKQEEMKIEKLKQGLKRIIKEAETVGQAQWIAQVTLEDL